MDAMTILNRCRDSANDIRRLRLAIQRRRDALMSVSAPQADPSGGSRKQMEPDKIGEKLADIDALEKQWKARKQRQAAEIAAACVLLDSLPELPSTVLHGYYIRRESVPAIAARLKYSEGYIRRMKKQGEEQLEAVPPEKVQAGLPPWYLREDEEARA